jgi:ribosomal protein S18 acetylase RimI-like enzyme
VRLDAVLDALRGWQLDGAPMQLHPGDVGWFCRHGAEATAAAIRTWSRDGSLLAVGLLDGAVTLRLTTAPENRRDEELARRLLADITTPERGVLPAGPVNVETPADALVRKLLAADGWVVGEAWTPLSRDLSEPVEEPPLRIETVNSLTAEPRAELQRASFDGSTFGVESWRAMAAGPAYAQARCLLGHDERDDAVAMATVWSAGPGRPGLLEPVGVSREHRRRGHGRAITLAAAAALRELGSSSAFVATPSANRAAVATYRAAGFTELTEAPDLRRPG